MEFFLILRAALICAFCICHVVETMCTSSLQKQCEMFNEMHKFMSYMV